MVLTKIKAFLKKLTLKEQDPRKLALAFCVGVYIAFSPFPGFHTLMVLASSWFLALSFPVVLAVSCLINNPWTMVPVYASGHIVGDWLCLGLFNVESTTSWNPWWMHSINDWLTRYIDMPHISLWSFLIGGNLLGIGLAIMLYPLMLYVFKDITGTK
jgi:uncharacterized protein (DUF2062 family)